MIIFKYIVLIAIFSCSFWIGNLISKKYKCRVIELREIREFVNILSTKIRFTYEPLKDIFEDISKMPCKMSNILKKTCENMKNSDVRTSWEGAIENTKGNFNLNNEDIEIIKGLGKFLRKNR